MGELAITRELGGSGFRHLPIPGKSQWPQHRNRPFTGRNSSLLCDGPSPELVAGLYLEDISPHFVAHQRHVGSAFIAALKNIGLELKQALAADEKGSEMADRIAGISLGDDITFGDVRSDEQLQIMADGVLQMDPKIFGTFFEDDSIPPFDLDDTIRAIQYPVHITCGAPELGTLFLERLRRSTRQRL